MDKIREIADKADMIVNGYAFTRRECELWTDNHDMELSSKSLSVYTYSIRPELSKVAEKPVFYGK